MAAPQKDSDLAQQLRAQLEWVELHLHNQANLVGGDETDPGTSDWWASATVRVLPDEDEADGINPWHEIEGTALSTKPSDDSLEIKIFEANGLTVDLQRVEGVHDALDARSEDYAKFIPLFGGRDQFGFVTLRDDLEDEVESLGSHVVIIDRVRLAPAWRGLGGVGRLLTGRLLRWICADPRLVAVLPFPIDLDRDLLKDDAAFEPALEKIRHTWASLGFRPATEQLWIMDPAIGTHHNAVAQLEKTLGI
ncbi:hypothetical protein GCM10027598_20690 [Amycolatopsis oliviviridis]|uniref:N-acetyltransferase domain-containing protein n=1 Tax=Amycolatopsis oliviviridis TaxID=1471590 RepID=A0ABQ3LGG7_9PSEU|nr:hypothetical protein [Amycolatopsis oliviviridis]GHH14711.1 hypothetical protein GCM10017790_28340 [Amycolatopsis oliviviridis]